MMVRSNVRNLSMGLFVIGMSGCAGQMPSVGNFMHPTLASGNLSFVGKKGGVSDRMTKYDKCASDADSARGLAGTVCDQYDLTSEESSGWLKGSLYLGDRFRVGMESGLFAASNLVGGVRVRGFGAMGWLNFLPENLPALAGSGGAIAYRWDIARVWHPGLFGYVAQNEYLRVIDEYAGYHVDDRVRFTEVGLGGWLHLGNPSGVSVEGKAGREVGTGRYRAYFGINLHLGWSSNELSGTEPDR